MVNVFKNKTQMIVQFNVSAQTIPRVWNLYSGTS